MKSILIGAMFVGIGAASAFAVPRGVPLPDMSPQDDLLVTVATASQKAAARADCRKRYGKRLVNVTFTATKYNCVYRNAAKANGPSNKDWVKSADQQCKKQGMRFMKIISNAKDYSNIMCVR